MRGPLLPPYGLVFMAWAPDGEIEAWLDAEGLEDDGKRRYRELLAQIRQRGYSTSADGDDRQRIEQAIETVIRDAGHADIAQGLRKLMTDLARDRSELSDVQPNGRYRVRVMAAPIFDTDGRVRIGLTLTGLPELTGTQLRDHGYALSAAAARISKRIGGHLATADMADSEVAA
jgi:DNA-binding IclR family transcriptional regulator